MWREFLGQERQNGTDVAGRILGAKRGDDLMSVLAEIVCKHGHGRIGQTRAGETRRLRRRPLAWRPRRRRAGRIIRRGIGHPVGSIRNRHDVRRRTGALLAWLAAHDGFSLEWREAKPRESKRPPVARTARAHLSGPNSTKSHRTRQPGFCNRRQISRNVLTRRAEIRTRRTACGRSKHRRARRLVSCRRNEQRPEKQCARRSLGPCGRICPALIR